MEQARRRAAAATRGFGGQCRSTNLGRRRCAVLVALLALVLTACGVGTDAAAVGGSSRCPARLWGLFIAWLRAPIGGFTTPL